MKRSRIKPRRDTPRRREAPRWTADEWEWANQLLAVRSGGRCECCGRELEAGEWWERHHRQRRRDGGDRLANVVLLRSTCHKAWTEHPDHAVKRGVIVPAYTRDPAAVPLLHLGSRWVVLDDEGGVTALPGEGGLDKGTDDVGTSGTVKP